MAQHPSTDEVVLGEIDIQISDGDIHEMLRIFQIKRFNPGNSPRWRWRG